jgi:hypothetical protein
LCVDIKTQKQKQKKQHKKSVFVERKFRSRKLKTSCRLQLCLLNEFEPNHITQLLGESKFEEAAHYATAFVRLGHKDEIAAAVRKEHILQLLSE